MPRGDRTGPTGMGPRSGRAAGYCAGYDTPGFMSRFFGRGACLRRPNQRLGQLRPAGRSVSWGGGFGNRGGRFGWRNMFRNTGSRGFGWLAGLPGWMRFGGNFSEQPYPDAGAEKKALENQVDFLKSQLDQLQKRLSVLETTDADR